MRISAIKVVLFKLFFNKLNDLNKSFVNIKYNLIYIRVISFFHPYMDKKYSLLVDCLNDIQCASNDIERINVTNTGVVQVYTSRKVFMVPGGCLSRKSLKKSKENYNILRNSIASELVEYDFYSVDSKHGSWFVSDRLRQPENVEFLLSDILRKLGKSTSVRRLDIKHYLRLAKIYNVDRVFCRCNFEVEEFKHGFSHGDLTHENILINSNDSPVIIDLDRFEVSGLQFIDELHFLVQLEAEKDSTNWLEILAELMGLSEEDRLNRKIKHENKLLILYFIQRLDNELRGNEPSYFYDKHIKKFLRSIHSGEIK